MNRNADRINKLASLADGTKVPKRNRGFAALIEAARSKQWVSLSELFDHRAPLGTLERWQSGVNPPPPWARDLIARKALAALPPYKGRGSVRVHNIATYQSRKRDAATKEKARHDAGLPPSNLTGD